MSAEASCIAVPVGVPDADLVAAVRAGDNDAFEQLYRRYDKPIEGFVRRMVRDPGRAEDVTQEVFFSALRRLRATDAELAFKPWIYEIARNASIDQYRRTSRAEEVSIDEVGSLRLADRARLVSSAAPETIVHGKRRFEHLRGALEELPTSHNRIIVLRELEGLSYREIAERMEMSRGAVESTLFRARRRLEVEFSEIDTGKRCIAVRRLAARQVEGDSSPRERLRVDRHLRRCPPCARHARALGLERADVPLRARVAALLPLPALLRRGAGGASGPAHQGSGLLAPLAGQGGDAMSAVAAKAAVVLGTAALVSGGAALGGGGPIAKQLRLDRSPLTAPAPQPARSRAPRSSAQSAREAPAGAAVPTGGLDPSGLADLAPAPALPPAPTPAPIPAAPQAREPVVAPPVPARPATPPAPRSPHVKVPPAPRLPAPRLPKLPSPPVVDTEGLVPETVATNGLPPL